jgi:hypothetical protein
MNINKATGKDGISVKQLSFPMSLATLTKNSLNVSATSF